MSLDNGNGWPWAIEWTNASNRCARRIRALEKAVRRLVKIGRDLESALTNQRARADIAEMQRDSLDAEVNRLTLRVVELEVTEERAKTAAGILTRFGDIGGMPALRALRGEES